MQLSEETNVPMRWVFILLAGASAFVGTAVGLGVYFGSRDAKAENVVQRVEKLEADVDVLNVLDRRLLRLEIRAGIDVPKEDRLPASQHGP